MSKERKSQDPCTEQSCRKAFLCLSDKDSGFVDLVVPHMKRNMDEVYYYNENQNAFENWKRSLDKALKTCGIIVIFVGQETTDAKGEVRYLSTGQENEINHIEYLKEDNPDLHIFACLIGHRRLPVKIEGSTHGFLSKYKLIPDIEPTEKGAFNVVKEIMRVLEKPMDYDGLPVEPHLFSYEKDIINHYITKKLLCCPDETGVDLDTPLNELIQKFGVSDEPVRQLCEKIDLDWDGPVAKQLAELIAIKTNIKKKELDGCPPKWPSVQRYVDDRRSLDAEYKRIINTKGKSDGEIEAEIQDRKDNWESKAGSFRKHADVVVAAALSKYHDGAENGEKKHINCMMKQDICFPEAGPREFVNFPRRNTGLEKGKHKLTVGILVSGGIAPGVNAVIDGIVQRHRSYANEFDYLIEEIGKLDRPVFNPKINGLENGFLAFPEQGDISTKNLSHIDTSHQASEGGSLLGTSRFDDLLDRGKRRKKSEEIVGRLYKQGYDILYIIGGDGSMKAAHALWTVAQDQAEAEGRPPLSIVAIPKTMDNDILWVWQTFGFLSAVEKAREIIGHLSTEVVSNPRLCIAQLYGSDSGFVVSHAVLASRPEQCDVALIPEVDFSIGGVAEYLRDRMTARNEPVPRGLVVMAETAVPRDAMEFVELDREIKRRIDEEKNGKKFAGRKTKKETENQDNGEKRKERKLIIGLTEEEERAISDFDHTKRIEGQTPDELRSAALKLVSRGLQYLLENPRDPNRPAHSPRVVTNEPRHLLRAISPSCTDIIMGNRLGTLAVDNAIAGYTDFMISQWLTEYVLVPLELVALGRKRIPRQGIFWKSVIGKTGQPADLLSGAVQRDELIDILDKSGQR